jgi:transcription elongation GreA/GreB family factor
MIEYNKQAILQETIRIMERTLEDLLFSNKSVKERAIAAPGANVSHSDTSKNQLQTLSFGLDQRISDARTDLYNLKEHKPTQMSTVALGSLIYIENVDKGDEKHYYILPGCAGALIPTDQGDVTIIAPRSPLFLAMRGKQADDEFVFQHNGSKTRYYVVEIE